MFASDPDRLTRFHREARMLASLNHPHIGAIHGVEQSEGSPALILELVEGPTLADRLATGPIPLTESLRIVWQIADALEAAHARGIVHRDLKPANIKITPDGIVKVLDFGGATGPLGDAGGTAEALTPLAEGRFLPQPAGVGIACGLVLPVSATHARVSRPSQLQMHPREERFAGDRSSDRPCDALASRSCVV
ncbi:MAG: serine/threonine-protein kinase [Vicinamibacterales bacterium]